MCDFARRIIVPAFHFGQAARAPNPGSGAASDYRSIPPLNFFESPGNPVRVNRRKRESTTGSLVSNRKEHHFMAQGTQFRTILPISQTILATIFGGWGLWLRNSILSHPFWGDSTLWDSTARFHVWPWPFKFAAVLNMPAFLAGSLLSWPLDALRPGLPEWVSILPVLPLVALLWYRIGFWLDQERRAHKSRNTVKGQWTAFLLFMVICAAASSIPERIGGYTSYLLLGIAVWTIAAIGLRASAFFRKRRPTPA